MYRNRNPIIVLYDSEVQKGFEQLVHSIGSGRNHIRKARLAIRMERMASVSASYKAEENMIPRFPVRAAWNAPSRYELFLAQGLRNARGYEIIRPDGTTDGLDKITITPDPCAVADQALDKAQAFCETGAYRFLREGECNEEVLGARAMFESLKETCEREAGRLTILERARQTERDVERAVEQDRHRQSRMEIAANPALIQHEGCNATIEADDEDDDEEDDLDYGLLMPPYRKMART